MWDQGDELGVGKRLFGAVLLWLSCYSKFCPRQAPWETGLEDREPF